MTIIATVLGALLGGACGMALTAGIVVLAIGAGYGGVNLFSEDTSEPIVICTSVTVVVLPVMGLVLGGLLGRQLVRRT